MPQLAQLNIARLKHPLDSPQLKDFVDNLEPINQLAERSPGFVWRLQAEIGSAITIRAFSDPEIIVNLSVWESTEALKNFVYQSNHAGFVKRRREWFEHMKESYYVLWWVADGHRPSVEEARAKLDLLRREGESPEAFTFRSDYAANPVAIATKTEKSQC